jgi:hypothetical protein
MATFLIVNKAPFLVITLKMDDPKTFPLPSYCNEKETLVWYSADRPLCRFIAPEEKEQEMKEYLQGLGFYPNSPVHTA